MVTLGVSLPATRPHTHVEAAVATQTRLSSFAAVCVVPETTRLPVGPHRLHAHKLSGHANVVGFLSAPVTLTSLLLASTALLLP